MSLQPEAIAYHTNPSGDSDFFFGSGGGGGGGIPYPVQTALTASATQTFSPSSVNPKQFDTGITLSSSATYVVSVNVQFASSAPASNDMFLVSAFNASGAVNGAIINAPFPAGVMDLATISPVAVSITLSGVLANPSVSNLVVYVATTNAPAGTYTVNINNVVVQRLT